ncbi:hypothetical protein EHQ46_17230 [Leptospira yanagawae]|uniref:Uncharacterized protein n=1 Tax=Leptospira yanagawae TaxID=293069 RepID=A0ABY2LWU4_9LEPT|nr:glycosyltransferase family protein [Leptospira yanagawae]TGL16971.1 hypothetical protein EHQ46_17230 [Leptospira yanagawae]
MNTLGIIQARMGSKRFPGKMMEPLAGYPIIEWVLRRCLKSKKLNKWVLATSVEENNEPLIKVASSLGVEVFRGEEDDVLSRFIYLKQLYKPNSIVRVCADNPFIDPIEIDRLILFFQANDFDYAFNHIPKLGNHYTDGLGAEIMTSDALGSLLQKKLNSSDREHVTSYIVNHPSLYKIGTFSAPDNKSYPHIRLDVDQIEDLEKLNQILNLGSHFLPEDIKTEEILEKMNFGFGS